MVTQRQRRKSKKKTRKKPKSKQYKCQSNYPKSSSSRINNSKNGKFTIRFIDYFYRQSSHDIRQKLWEG